MAITSIAKRLTLGWGKARRFYLVHFNKKYVRRSIERRHGQCSRCGSCCRLMFKCRYLNNGGDDYECVVHGRRRKNCQVFPIDERDIADRDRVSTDGPCGYVFEPTDGKARWFALSVLVSLGLATLVSAAPAREAAAPQPTVHEASFRGVRPAAASYPPPAGLNTGLNGGARRARPTPGWYPVSGKWRSGRGGFVAETEGELRCDPIEIGRSDFRAAVLADISGAAGGDGQGPLLAVEVGGLRGGLASAECAFVELKGRIGDENGRDRSRGRLDRPLGRGRFWLVVETDDGLVSVRTSRNRPILKRDVFRRWSAGQPGGVAIHARAGVTVYAVRVRTLPGRERPEALASADEAVSRGQESVRAGALYSEALADEGLLPRERAEAAYKLGLLIKRSEPAEAAQAGPRRCPDDAARAFDRAKRLDPEGPWGERARLELARAALEAGREDLALAFAHRLVKNAAPGLEEWEDFQELVSTARERVVSAERGARATYQLRLMAQYLEWADSPRERVLWAWNEAALSYAGRGWHAEADAVRDRAERLLARGGLLGRLFGWMGPRAKSKDAPSILPAPDSGRGLKE